MSAAARTAVDRPPRPARRSKRWAARAVASGLALLASLVVTSAGTGAVQSPTSCPAVDIAMVNGGFEQPDITGITLINADLVPGWETTATDNIIELWQTGAQGVPSAEGSQFAELNAFQVSTLFQDVATVPGTVISYQVFHRGRAGVDTAELQFGPPAGPANFTRSMTDGNTAWGRYAGVYTIPDGQTVTRFAFASISSAGGNPTIGNFIDGVQFGTPPCVLTSKTVTNLAGTTPAHPGDQLEYAVTVTNGGGNDASSLVETDPIPAGTAFVPGSLEVLSGPNAGAKTDAPGDDQAEFDAVGNRVRIRVGTGATAIAGGVLSSNQDTTVRFRVTVLPAADGTTVTNAAATSWTNPVDPNVTLISTSNDATIAVTAPAVALVKSFTGNADADGDGQVSVGDTLGYALTAANTGTERLSAVTVADPRLTNLTCAPATSLGNPFVNGASGLDPGEEVVCTGTTVVTQADVDAGEVENIGAVAATGTTGIPVSATDSVTVPTEAEGPALAVAKSASPAAGAEVGDTVAYTVVATNTGNVTLAGVTVTDPTLGTLTCLPTAPAALAPGQSTVCTADRIVTQADVDAGFIANTASASGTSPGGTLVTESDSLTTPTAPRVGLLTIGKVMSEHTDLDGNGSVSTGDELEYTITVTNAGNVTQTGVTVTDPLLGALACTPTQPATLAPTEGLVCTATYTVTQPDVDAGSVVNTATATGDPPPGVTNPPAEVTVDTLTEAAVPRLSVAKTVRLASDPDLSGSFTPGDTVTYTVLTANTGNVTLTGVTVTDPLLPLLTCIPLVPTTLLPGDTITCTGAYVLTSTDGTNGSVTNTATATGLPPVGPAVVGTGTATIVVTEPDPAIDVTKALAGHIDVDDSGTITVGDQLTYEVTITNTGNVLLTGVVASDTRSALTCAPTLPASLAPGAAVTCTGSVTVTQADQDAGEVANTASASGLDPAGATIADTADSVVATEGRAPEATFAKTVTGIDDANDNGRADVGETVDYQLTFTNTGNVTLTSALIGDDRIPVLPCVPTQPATLAPGESLVCTGSLVVTQADQDAGVIVNDGAAGADTPIGSLTRTDQAVVLPAPAQPSLETTKVGVLVDADGSGAPSLGETITYTITTTNTGNVTVSGVAVTDPLVPGLVCVPAVPATLVPGAAIVCTGTYTVTQADVDRGRVGNVATATAEDPSGTDVTGVGVASRAPDPPAPALSLTKTAGSVVDADGSGDLSAGDIVPFTIVATNTGNVTLDGVTVSDPLLPAMTCVPALPAVLAPGAAVTCTGSHVVTADEGAAGVVTNVAVADAADTFGPFTAVLASAQVRLVPPPAPPASSDPLPATGADLDLLTLAGVASLLAGAALCQPAVIARRRRRTTRAG